ncbi:MAG: NUDIX domain-containing protein [Thaumarchaeota archaeon]|nr:NUDIX domain-containing protein [Nitrososphaerota archaeon]
MKTRVFTSGILVHKGKVLILKRRQDDDEYPGLWDCLGGHFEEGESAEACMTREAKEESGLDVGLVRPGRLIEYSDRYGRSIAVPFLLRSRSARVVLTEHSESRWVSPSALARYRKVPAMIEALCIFGLVPKPAGRTAR